MSTPEFEANTSEPSQRVERRNLFVRVEPSLKLSLKTLASASGMTLEEYANAVLAEAVTTDAKFKLVPVLIDGPKVRNEGGQP